MEYEPEKTKATDQGIKRIVEKETERILNSASGQNVLDSKIFEQVIIKQRDFLISLLEKDFSKKRYEFQISGNINSSKESIQEVVIKNVLKDRIVKQIEQLIERQGNDAQVLTVLIDRKIFIEQFLSGNSLNEVNKKRTRTDGR